VKRQGTGSREQGIGKAKTKATTEAKVEARATAMARPGQDREPDTEVDA
jgi:hypothetical protein